jgi:hypothetical protein
MDKLTEDRFLKDVQDHKLIVILDDGVNRHIRLTTGSSCYQFDLITWPGHLCYTGDVGTYVFSRLHDMFDFFREKNTEYYKSKGIKLPVNLGYWSEKVEASDKHDGLKKWSGDKFKENVLEYISHCDIDPNIKSDFLKEIEDEIFKDPDHEWTSVYSIQNFTSDIIKDFEFSDFFECDCTVFSGRYQWCCFAIVWGIMQYDKHKSNLQVEQTITEVVAS